jgi:hypothetical protein
VGVPDFGQRLALASIARRPEADTAIFGNSTIQLLDPARISELSGRTAVSPAVPGTCVYRKPHMGISESRGKKSLVHELRLRCLFRYPRSKPDSVIWLFLARSTSHPVVAQSDCTNIPLAAGGAQENETILNSGFLGHGFRRFVHLDPPGLTVLED